MFRYESARGVLPALLGLSLFIAACGNTKSTAEKSKNSDKESTNAWVNPRKGKIWDKVNVIEIPLTAIENHIMGPVKEEHYIDYQAAPGAQDSSGVIADSGLNVYDRYGHLVSQNVFYNNGKLKYSCVYTYNPKNQIEELDYKNFEKELMNVKTKYVYDGKGRKAEEVTIKDGIEIVHSTYAYDDRGNVSKEMGYSSKGKLERTTTYRYDDAGNEVEIADRNGEGKLQMKVRATYDANGNKTGVEQYSKDTLHPVGINMKFTDKGWLEEIVGLDSNGKMNYRSTTKYDKWGNGTEYLFYKPDGSLDEPRCNYIEYECDKMGNPIVQKDYSLKEGQKARSGMRKTRFEYY